MRKRAQPVPHAAVGQDHLEAEHQLAHVAVAQDAGAAGIGRHECRRSRSCRTLPSSSGNWRWCFSAASRTWARMQPASAVSELLRGIDLPDPVQAREVEDHGRPVAVGDGAAGEARVAALRHDGHVQAAAGLHELSDLVGAAGHQDRERRAPGSGRASPAGTVACRPDRSARATGRRPWRTARAERRCRDSCFDAWRPTRINPS